MASRYLPAITLVFLAGCATLGTTGDRFRKAMADRKDFCARYESRPGDMTCEILKLKASDPLPTAEERFAHAIVLPEQARLPVAPYRGGIAAADYFRLLCEREAGEFIFARVDGVEGITQMRPRPLASDHELQHLYALEDPYGYQDWEARNAASYFVHPQRYRYLERFQSNDGRSRSRYGYTWRGISRPHDRELGIAGGEIIVLDLQTGQVLGVKRGYVRTGEGFTPGSTGVWWRLPATCPGHSFSDSYFAADFVLRVLRPAAMARP